MDNQLYHHGILGMRWGVRRSKAQLSGSKVSKAKPKKAKDMTDEELKSSISRMQLEKQYNNLKGSKVKTGWKYVVAAAGVMGTAISIYNNVNTLTGIGKKAYGSGKAYVDRVKSLPVPKLKA